MKKAVRYSIEAMVWSLLLGCLAALAGLVIYFAVWPSISALVGAVNAATDEQVGRLWWAIPLSIAETAFLLLLLRLLVRLYEWSRSDD